jgi:hypothetical protein
MMRFNKNVWFLATFLLINLKFRQQIDSSCLISSNFNNYSKHEIVQCNYLQNYGNKSIKVYRCSCNNMLDSLNNETYTKRCIEAHPGKKIYSFLKLNSFLVKRHVN